MSLADRLAQSERPDRLEEVRNRVQDQLVESLGPRLYDATLSDTELTELVHRRVQGARRDRNDRRRLHYGEEALRHRSEKEKP